MFANPTPYNGHLWAGRTVGLLGGSFNPAHDGHRHISLHALQRVGLDCIWWMVSPQNPLKSSFGMAPLPERVLHAKKIARHPKILVTDIEAQIHTQYTADTLRRLNELFPATRFVWLMGTDNLRQIHRWQEWETIFNSVPVCVLDRPPRGNALKSCPAGEKFRSSLLPQEKAGLLREQDPPAWTILHIPLNDISATAIRAAGNDISY